MDHKHLGREAHEAIKQARVIGEHGVKIQPLNLSRPVYAEVDECLRRLGGRWLGGRTQAHVFPEHVPIAELLESVQRDGVMPENNPLDFYATPPDVVDGLLVCADLKAPYGVDSVPWVHKDARVLEPSAGTGAIADAVKREWPGLGITCVELNPLNARHLIAKGHVTAHADFLALPATGDTWGREGFDYVVMNPPFTAKGAPLLWVDHVEHAWSLVVEGGRLASIVPASIETRSDARIRALRRTILIHGGIEPVNPGVFKGSGTTVETRIIWMRKNGEEERRKQPYDGARSWNRWAFDLWAGNEERLYRERERLLRVLSAANQGVLHPEYITYSALQHVRDYVIKVCNWAERAGEWVELTDQEISALACELVDEAVEAGGNP